MAKQTEKPVTPKADVKIVSGGATGDTSIELAVMLSDLPPIRHGETRRTMAQIAKRGLDSWLRKQQKELHFALELACVRLTSAFRLLSGGPNPDLSSGPVSLHVFASIFLCDLAMAFEYAVKALLQKQGYDRQWHHNVRYLWNKVDSTTQRNVHETAAQTIARSFGSSPDSYNKSDVLPLPTSSRRTSNGGPFSTAPPPTKAGTADLSPLTTAGSLFDLLTFQPQAASHPDRSSKFVTGLPVIMAYWDAIVAEATPLNLRQQARNAYKAAYKGRL